MASRNVKNGFYKHFLVIEGVPNIVMVNIATLHISLLLARTSIFVRPKIGAITVFGLGLDSDCVYYLCRKVMEKRMEATGTYFVSMYVCKQHIYGI